MCNQGAPIFTSSVKQNQRGSKSVTASRDYVSNDVSILPKFGIV